MKNQSAGVAQLGSWYAVAAVAAASFGLAASAQQADAAPVIVHPVGGPVTAPPTAASSLGGVVFNLLDPTGTAFATIPPASGFTGSLNVAIVWDHLANGNAGAAALMHAPVLGIVIEKSAGSPGHLYAAKLDANTAINSSLFGFGARLGSQGALGLSRSGSHIGSWQPGDTGFIGLAVTASSKLHFGGAEIHLSSDFDPTLIAWGFNDTPFAPDVTPNLPEPSSLLLLASGAAGLAAYRRRRAQRRAAAQ